MAKARAAAIDSTKDMRAMPSAPGHRAFTNERSGREKEGSPVGISPTSLTPCASRLSSAETRIPKATATRGAGRRLVRRGRKIKMASVTRASTKVSQWI